MKSHVIKMGGTREADIVGLKPFCFNDGIPEFNMTNTFRIYLEYCLVGVRRILEVAPKCKIDTCEPNATHTEEIELSCHNLYGLVLSNSIRELYQVGLNSFFPFKATKSTDFKGSSKDCSLHW